MNKDNPLYELIEQLSQEMREVGTHTLDFQKRFDKFAFSSVKHTDLLKTIADSMGEINNNIDVMRNTLMKMYAAQENKRQSAFHSSEQALEPTNETTEAEKVNPEVEKSTKEAKPTVEIKDKKKGNTVADVSSRLDKLILISGAMLILLKKMPKPNEEDPNHKQEKHTSLIEKMVRLVSNDEAADLFKKKITTPVYDKIISSGVIPALPSSLSKMSKKMGSRLFSPMEPSQPESKNNVPNVLSEPTDTNKTVMSELKDTSLETSDVKLQEYREKEDREKKALEEEHQQTELLKKILDATKKPEKKKDDEKKDKEKEDDKDLLTSISESLITLSPLLKGLSGTISGWLGSAASGIGSAVSGAGSMISGGVGAANAALATTAGSALALGGVVAGGAYLNYKTYKETQGIKEAQTSTSKNTEEQGKTSGKLIAAYKKQAQEAKTPEEKELAELKIQQVMLSQNAAEENAAYNPYSMTGDKPEDSTSRLTNRAKAKQISDKIAELQNKINTNKQAEVQPDDKNLRKEYPREETSKDETIKDVESASTSALMDDKNLRKEYPREETSNNTLTEKNLDPKDPSSSLSLSKSNEELNDLKDSDRQKPIIVNAPSTNISQSNGQSSMILPVSVYNDDRSFFSRKPNLVFS